MPSQPHAGLAATLLAEPGFAQGGLEPVVAGHVEPVLQVELAGPASSEVFGVVVEAVAEHLVVGLAFE